MVRKDQGSPCSAVSHMSYAEIAEAIAVATGEEPGKPDGVLAKIHQALQPVINEMFFTRRLILVEGPEDVAYLLAYLNLLEKSEDYRRMGCHIVPTNGKSELLRPLIIAKHMRIPTYVIFDADADKPDKNGSRAKHEKDNKALLALLDKPDEDSMPDAAVWSKGFTMWHSDIGSVVTADIGRENWEAFCAKADKRYGHAGGLRKNALHIGASLAFAWEEEKHSANLKRLCTEILSANNVVPV